ncbi:MAG: MraY family glycosyltransferase [Verrucomicrobiae bacterium]|nr:MraY family glycosyltransferase [Verrucomicrobiae bacterium]
MLNSLLFWWTAACGGLGLVTAFLLTPVVCDWSRRFQLTDRARQFHHTNMVDVPRLGGVVLMASFVAAVGMAVFFLGVNRLSQEVWVMILTSQAMFTLGFWDDIRPLGAKFKFGAQILIASIAFHGGLQIDTWTNFFTGSMQGLGILSWPVTVFWLVAVTNLINLMDGIDGLAAGACFMLMLLLAAVGWNSANVTALLLAAGMAGGMGGFLFYNFPPARIFMGDGGAYFAGFLIAELSLLSSNKGTIAAALVVPFIAMGLPIIDASFALVRRGLRGLPIFRADRQHVHHRLVAMGLTQSRAVWILYAISAGFGILALGGFAYQGRLFPILFGILMVLMVLAARFFGFVQDWYKVGYLLSNAIQSRRKTRFALHLGRWLEMEAERCENLDELWNLFVFMLRRFGFTEARLVAGDGAVVRRMKVEGKHSGESWRNRILLNDERNGALELAIPAEVLPSDFCQLYAELAAEYWQKAELRWRQIHPERSER